jgi:hypothetical protein
MPLPRRDRLLRMTALATRRFAPAFRSPSPSQEAWKVVRSFLRAGVAPPVFPDVGAAGSGFAGGWTGGDGVS